MAWQYRTSDPENKFMEDWGSGDSYHQNFDSLKKSQDPGDDPAIPEYDGPKISGEIGWPSWETLADWGPYIGAAAMVTPFIPNIRGWSSPGELLERWAGAGARSVGRRIPANKRPDGMQNMHDKLNDIHKQRQSFAFGNQKNRNLFAQAGMGSWMNNAKRNVSDLKMWRLKDRQVNNLPEVNWAFGGNVRLHEAARAAGSKREAAEHFLRTGENPDWMLSTGEYYYKYGKYPKFNSVQGSLPYEGLHMADAGRRSAVSLNTAEGREYMQSAANMAFLFEGGELAYRGSKRLSNEILRYKAREAFPEEDHNELFYALAYGMAPRSEFADKEMKNLINMYGTYNKLPGFETDDPLAMRATHEAALDYGLDKLDIAGEDTLNTEFNVKKNFYNMDISGSNKWPPEFNRTEAYNREAAWHGTEGGNRGGMDEIQYLLSDDNPSFVYDSRGNASKYGQNTWQNKLDHIRASVDWMEGLAQTNPAAWRAQIGQASPQQWYDLLMNY